MTPVAAPARNQRKTRIGIVLSAKMQKTIVVQVSQLVRHPKYNRTMKRLGSFKVHDETNQAGPGDWVRIMETRPLSKEKRWRLVEIFRRASSAPPVPQSEVETDKPRRQAPGAPEGQAASPTGTPPSAEQG